MTAVNRDLPNKAGTEGSGSLPRKALAKLRKQLEEERDRLLRQREGLEQQLRELHESGSEENGFGSHPADVSGDTYLEETQASLLDNTQLTLQQIEQALDRMQKGVYGLCVDCRAAIPLERLEARPYAARCVSCQATFDRKQRERAVG